MSNISEFNKNSKDFDEVNLTYDYSDSEISDSRENALLYERMSKDKALHAKKKKKVVKTVAMDRAFNKKTGVVKRTPKKSKPNNDLEL